jgi:glycosyltransferase involved in cell wall biosynthesis
MLSRIDALLNTPVKYYNQFDFEKEFRRKTVVEFPNQAPEQPLVSVCLQTYQHGKFIAQCLQNMVDQQTDFPYEIIVGDDESTDGTREICIDFAKKYPDKIRLMLHHRVNNIVINGAFTGRYNLIHNYFNAKGKYIAWCEGDDYWTDPNKLQKQITFHENHPDCIASFHNAMLEDESQAQSIFYSWDKIKKVDPKYLLVDAIAGFPTASVVFNKIIDPIPECLFKIRAADVGISFLLLNKGDFYYLPDNMCVYRKHAGGNYSSILKNLIYMNSLEEEIIEMAKILKPNFRLDLKAFLDETINISCKRMLFRAYDQNNDDAFNDAVRIYKKNFSLLKSPDQYNYLMKTIIKYCLRKMKSTFFVRK